jgi:hypothetical protein
MSAQRFRDGAEEVRGELEAELEEPNWVRCFALPANAVPCNGSVDLDAL